MFRANRLVAFSAVSMMSAARAETFVIAPQRSGAMATIRIPVGAVKNLSANSARSLDDYADQHVEAMRLSGNVLIRIEGIAHPIEIQADSVILELTADRPVEPVADAGRRRGEGGRRRGERKVFDLQTASGPMQIEAGEVRRLAGVGQKG